MAGDLSDVESFVLAPNGHFPNSDLPVLVYHHGITGQVNAAAIQELFGQNDWPPQWVDTIFDYYHYHSTAHEVLGVASGEGRLGVGGPGRRLLEMNTGDVVVIPAGVAHKLEEASEDFAVVGAYPPGEDWDTLKGEEGEWEMAIRNIARLPLPRTDPVGGTYGPLIEHWHEG